MLSDLFWLVIVVLIVEFVWRFVSRMWTTQQPIEPTDDADILAELRPRPTLNSGAVAVEEPDEELDSATDLFVDPVRQSRPPRKTDDQSGLTS